MEDEDRMNMNRKQVTGRWYGGLPASPAAALLFELDTEEKQGEIRRKHGH